MNDREGYQLKWSEILAIMSLAGKTEWIGLETDSVGEFTEETFWNACCALMQDGLLLQHEETYYLCDDLVGIMKPLFEATVLWAITPQDDCRPQLLVYMAEEITVTMEPTGYGTYSLTAVSRAETEAVICEHMGMSLSELLTEDTEEAEWTACDPSESVASLLNGAQYVLEMFDIQTRQRCGWMRMVEDGVYHRMQWCRWDQSIWEPLSEEAFGRAWRTLTEGGVDW